jgi:PTS system mannose-specific IIA component
MVVDQPVRAGQRIWAEGADLIITSTVNAGAEVIAGVNLPLLLKLAQIRDGETLAGAVAAAKDAGQKYITIASERVTAGR